MILLGSFFRSCWQIVKDDPMAAVNPFYTRNLHYLNQAWVVLILKKPNAEKVKGFRPISLIHHLPSSLQRFYLTV
jgi:hypothetical protein